MSSLWEHVLADLDDAALVVERACVDGRDDVHLPLVGLPRTLGPLPASLTGRATAVLDRMRRAEQTLEAACERARRALVIADAATPAASPRFIDTRS